MIFSTITDPGQIRNQAGRRLRFYRLATARSALGVSAGAMHFYFDGGIGRIDPIPNCQSDFLRMPPASTQKRVGNGFVQSNFHAIEIPLPVACALQIQ